MKRIKLIRWHLVWHWRPTWHKLHERRVTAIRHGRGLDWGWWVLQLWGGWREL